MEHFLSLTIDATVGEVSASGYYTVTADIANESAQTASTIAVVISGYNAEDEIRAFRIIELAQDMLAGESARVEAAFTVPAKEINRFAVSALGRTNSP